MRVNCSVGAKDWRDLRFFVTFSDDCAFFKQCALIVQTNRYISNNETFVWNRCYEFFALLNVVSVRSCTFKVTFKVRVSRLVYCFFELFASVEWAFEMRRTVAFNMPLSASARWIRSTRNSFLILKLTKLSVLSSMKPICQCQVKVRAVVKVNNKSPLDVEAW